MITLISLIAALFLAAALPLTALILQAVWIAVGGGVLAALLWVLGVRYQNSALVHLGFVSLLSLDVFAMLSGQPPVFGQIGGLAALAAWDLSRFYHRRSAIHPAPAAQALEKQHLLKLAGVIASGLVIAGLSAVLRFNYQFVPAFFLSLLVLVSLRLVVSALIRATAPPDSEEER